MVSKLFSQYDEIIKKFDTKIKSETPQDLDTFSKLISDLKTLLSSSFTIVKVF
jgi:molybdopterin converting factor small subunit